MAKIAMPSAKVERRSTLPATLNPDCTTTSFKPAKDGALEVGDAALLAQGVENGRLAYAASC